MSDHCPLGYLFLVGVDLILEDNKGMHSMLYVYKFWPDWTTDNRVSRWDVPVGVPLDLSTPMGMSCIETYGENCKSDNVSKYVFY